jgi:hypothetical protein
MSNILRPTKKDISGHQLAPMDMLLLLMIKHMPDGVDEDHLTDLVHQQFLFAVQPRKPFEQSKLGD